MWSAVLSEGVAPRRVKRKSPAGEETLKGQSRFGEPLLLETPKQRRVVIEKPRLGIGGVVVREPRLG